MNATETRLEQGLYALGLNASNLQQQQLLMFLQLIIKWNRVYNLTSVDHLEHMLPLHLLDSLSIHSFLEGDSVLDVGTGAGIPGIPLAIMNPERRFTLLDSNAKKMRFVQQAVIELKLQQVTCVNFRIEQYGVNQQEASGFDSIVTRAYAALPLIVSQTYRLLAQEGVILAQKGRWPDTELAELKAMGFLPEAIRLQVPQLDAERHLVSVRKKNSQLGSVV